jgi:hypothetical protein
LIGCWCFHCWCCCCCCPLSWGGWADCCCYCCCCHPAIPARVATRFAEE